MGTHVSFIFRGYNPYIGGSKPSFLHGFWSPRVGNDICVDGCRNPVNSSVEVKVVLNL